MDIGIFWGGSLNFSYGVDTGWTLIGDPAIVTSSEGSVIHTIDDQPAIAFFRKYLGEGDLTAIVGFPRVSRLWLSASRVPPGSRFSA
jgi:hypothetical protein